MACAIEGRGLPGVATAFLALPAVGTAFLALPAVATAFLALTAVATAFWRGPLGRPGTPPAPAHLASVIHLGHSASAARGQGTAGTGLAKAKVDGGTLPLRATAPSGGTPQGGAEAIALGGRLRWCMQRWRWCKMQDAEAHLRARGYGPPGAPGGAPQRKKSVLARSSSIAEWRAKRREGGAGSLVGLPAVVLGQGGALLPPDSIKDST